MEPTPVQIRMARAALDLPVKELARQAGLHHNTVSAAERGDASRGTLAVLAQFFQGRGLQFIGTDKGGGPGVRISLAMLEGDQGGGK